MEPIWTSVTLLETEFVSISSKPCRTHRADEERRIRPFSMTAVRVNVQHAPVVHVSCFKTISTIEGDFPIRWSEVVINSGVNTSDLVVEQWICWEFKNHIVGRWCRGGPCERRRCVSSEVVTGLIPQCFTVPWRDKRRSNRDWVRPIVFDEETRLVIFRRSIWGMEGYGINTVVCGVCSVLRTRSHGKVKRIWASVVEMMLNVACYIEGKIITGLWTHDTRICCVTKIFSTSFIPKLVAGGSTPCYVPFTPNIWIGHLV